MVSGLRRNSECDIFSSQLSILEILSEKLCMKGLNIRESKDLVDIISTQSDAKKSNPKKKRKVDDLVAGMYDLIPSSSSQQVIYQCCKCSRSFPTEQGVKTHCYGVHVLNAGTDNCSRNEASFCEICQRQFPNNEAFQQHKLTKHDGSYTYISATWNTAKTIEEAPIEHASICSICNWRFPDEDTLKSHVECGIIPMQFVSHPRNEKSDATSVTCNICSKAFRDERAWKQHVNYCQSSVAL